jgi:hypothetical protein
MKRTHEHKAWQLWRQEAGVILGAEGGGIAPCASRRLPRDPAPSGSRCPRSQACFAASDNLSFSRATAQIRSRITLSIP